MPTERKSAEIKKSMAYDLITTLEENPEREIYTVEEIKKLIRNYIAASAQKQQMRSV